MNDYELDYYKSVFYTLSYQSSDTFYQDVKDTYYYVNTDDGMVGDLYKRAVDNILEAGLFINARDGQYYIEEEYIPQSDDSFTYDINDLSVGDEIGGMTITELSYLKDQSLHIVFKGDTIVQGFIEYSMDEYFGGNVYFLVVDDPYLFNESIRVTFADEDMGDYTYIYTLSYLLILNEEFFSSEQIEVLKAGKKLEGKIALEQITHLAVFYSSGENTCRISNLVDISIID